MNRFDRTFHKFDVETPTVVIPKSRRVSRPERRGDDGFSRPPSVLHDGAIIPQKSSCLLSAFPDDGHVS